MEATGPNDFAKHGRKRALRTTLL